MPHARYFQEWLDSMKEPRPVLLVEDDKDDCEMILRMSRNFNIGWCVSHTYEEAIERLRNCGSRFKLIILDLNLNDALKSGIDVFRQLKTRWPDIPVLVLSGHLTSEAIAEMTQIGFVIFAQKPQSFDERFFSQFFLALNIPRKPVQVAETITTTKETV